MAEVELTESLDTRDDAQKMARALWQEAVRRGWEAEYRDIIESTAHNDLIPVVGTVSAAFTVARSAEQLGVTGELLKTIAKGDGTNFGVTFTYEMETESADGSCACPLPEADRPVDDDPRYALLIHAKTALGEGNWLPLRYAPLPAGADKVIAECSSLECRNK